MKERRAPRLSLDLLRGFRAAAQHMSFTRAARELFVTQSAVSHEIKALEQQLGTPLFVRANRALQLTAAGHELLHAVDEALSIVDATAERIAGSAPTFAITTTVPLASTWLGPRLPRFTRLHPAFHMRLVATNDTLDIERERIDLAVRFVRRGNEPAAGEKVCDYEIFPVCSPGLARDRTRPIRSAADLSQHVLIDLETANNGRPWYDWKLWFDAKGGRIARPAGSLRFSHYDQVIDAAIAGHGVAIGKRPHIGRQLREGLLVAPLGKDAVAVPGSLRVIVSKSAPADVAASFVAWLHAEVERDAQPVKPVAGARQRRPGARAATRR